jgi:multidrug efflux pump subunit AcrB
MLHGRSRGQDVFSVIGFSLLDAATEPNAGFVVATPEAVQRPHQAASLGPGSDRQDLRRRRSRSAPRTAFRFNLPPIIGLSTSGGFEYQLEALEGQDPGAIGSVDAGLVGAANQDPRLARVFSTFTASTPRSTSTSTATRRRPRRRA